MGNGVVHMQQIQVLLAHNFNHFRGEYQLVGRVVKKRVLGNSDFVIKDIGPKAAQANRLIVGNEMDLMAICSEGLAQLRCHHAASPKCGVTYHSNPHMCNVLSRAHHRSGFLESAGNQQRILDDFECFGPDVFIDEGAV